MKIPTDASWIMRKILKLRKRGQDLVKHVRGAGMVRILGYD